MPRPGAIAPMIELLQLRRSPYNEKVRWALDLKRVPHRRRSLLPGPHVATLKRLTGRTTTPVIVDGDGRAIDGSARILEWIEQRWPQPALFPVDAADLAEARRIERRFDDDLTPRIRRTALDALLRHPAAFAAALPQAADGGRRQVFGCPAAFVNGHLFAGLHEDRLTVRLPDEAPHDAADTSRAESRRPVRSAAVFNASVRPLAAPSRAGASRRGRGRDGR